MNVLQGLVYSMLVVVGIMSMRALCLSRAVCSNAPQTLHAAQRCTKPTLVRQHAARCPRYCYSSDDTGCEAHPRCWDSLYSESYGYADPYDRTWRYPYWQRYGGCSVGSVGFGFGL